jgi:cytochrome c551/c552
VDENPTVRALTPNSMGNLQSCSSYRFELNKPIYDPLLFEIAMLRFLFLFGMVGSFTCPLFASKSNGNEPTEIVLYKANGCVACHRITQDHIGPSMLAVSQKYANDPNGVLTVLDSLKNGAKGKWGNNVMPPQSHVSDQNLQLLTNWALAIKDSPNLKSWQKEELVTQESNTILSADQPLNAKYSLPEDRRGTVVQTLDQPIVYRTYLPGASSRAIAVGLPGGISYAFDAKLCKLLYFWEGGFLDFEKSWTGHGGWYSKLMGTKIFEAPASFPLRMGSKQNPEVKFLGYRTEGELPSFLYQINGISVEETIGFDADNRTIVLSFKISDAEKPIYFDPGKSLSIWSSDDAVEQEGVWKVHPEKRKSFSFLAQVK